MDSFKHNLRYENDFSARLFSQLSPIIAKNNMSLMRNMWAEGRVAPYNVDVELQKLAGDFLIGDLATGTIVLNSDLKVERNSSRNIFFETYSNFCSDPSKVKNGWGMTAKCSVIWYAFSDTNVLCTLRLPHLREWLHEVEGRRPRIMRFHELQQKRHQQLNVTVGRLVPFADIPEPIWGSCYQLGEDEARPITRAEFIAIVSAGAEETTRRAP